MEQLTLFGASVARRPVLRRKRATAGSRNGMQGDLWSQGSEPEQFMALLFLDIRNFTPLAERHAPGRVVHMIQKLFSAFQRIIRVYHGRVIETTGDGLYAAFGFEHSRTASVEAAVAAGHAIFASLNAMNNESPGEHIQVGIGIHAGTVATGALRIHTKTHFIVMGHAVNVASRIQSATKELNNNFVVSREVYDQLAGSNGGAIRKKTRLKGIREEHEVCLIGSPFQ